MHNLWAYIVTATILIITSVACVVYCIVKKPKHGVIVSIVVSVFTVIFAVECRQEFADMIYQETIVTEGIYDRAGKGTLNSSAEYFDTANGEIVVYAFNWTRMRYKLKKGERYRVTYFANSQIVKSIVLIPKEESQDIPTTQAVRKSGLFFYP